MKFPLAVSIDPLSFVLGLVSASVLWWVLARARPLWRDIRSSLAKRTEESVARRMSGVEADHRRVTLRRAQGMHLAASLFALDEILQEPRVLAPPPRVEPGSVDGAEDAVTLTLPYMPSWPELAAVYNAPTLSLPEALSGGVNLVIIGQPGAGKTVALAHLASLSANRSDVLGPLIDFVPFLLHVADLAMPITESRELLTRFVEMASEHASVLDLGRVEAFVQSSFRSGRALLLLDGFDELTAAGQTDVSTYLSQVLQAFPGTRVVTTGAPEQLDGLLALGFVPLSIAAWNRRRQADFVERWGSIWSRSVAFEAWAQSGVEMPDPFLLSTWLDLNNYNLTPLELTLRVWAAYAGDVLGPQVLEAIESHVRRLAPVSTPFAALESLAMEVMLTAQPIFDPRRARAWIQEFELPEEAVIMAEAVAVTADAPGEGETENETPTSPRALSRPAPTPGLLGRLAASGLLVSFPGNKMRFVHPVFGGFLAGRALSAYKAEETLLNQPDWIGKVLTMRFFAAHADAGWLVDAMLKWSRLPMQRPALAAARWLRDAPHGAEWRGRLLAALAALIQADGLPMSLRGQALAALVTSNDPGVAALFRQLMGRHAAELAQLLALGSGALRDEKASPGLEEMIQTAGVTARRAACLALVAIGTPSALEAVAHALLSGDEDLRRAAAESLANDPTEGHAMLKDGAGMEDILLRRATVYGLGRVHETWATQLLETMRVEDDQWVVRNSADEMIQASSRTNDPRVPRPLQAPSETAWLIAFAGKQGVGISPGAPATDLLLAALKSPDAEERLAAVPYLKRNPTEGVVRQLYEAMFGGDPELREAAFSALWEIGASGTKLPDPTQFGLN